jgi:glutamate synthase domain-containing protein 3
LQDSEEIEFLKSMIFRHAEYTGSRRATEVLLAWDDWLSKFVRVLPIDYKRVLDAQKELKANGLTEEEAEMVAFGLNPNDHARAASK